MGYNVATEIMDFLRNYKRFRHAAILLWESGDWRKSVQSLSG